MMNIVTVLIQATALMLALMVLRPLLKRYVSPRLRCALWAIPTIRLLLPFELKSSLSIMAPAQTVSASISSTVTQPLDISAPEWLGSGIGMNTAPEMTAPSVEPIADSFLSISSVLTLIWLVGAAVTAGVIIWQNARFYKTVKRHSESLGNGFGLPVYLLRALPSPCLIGVFKPRIIINAQTLSSDEVFEMTIHHEMTHYKRLDHIWGVLRGALLALFWFHPLVWICSDMFHADTETACDAAATRGMDEEEKQSYGMALITLASRIPRGSTGRFVCLSTMSGSKKLLKERITALAKGRTFRTAALIALVLAAIMCFTMCTVPAERSSPDAPPPSPTPGFMGEAPLSTPAEPIPPEGVEEFSHDEPYEGTEGSLGDLAYYLELGAGSEFEDMDESEFESIMSEYGDLLKGSKFISRTSLDGQYAYIACLYQFQSPPIVHAMYSAEISIANEGSVQVLYTEDQSESVELALAGEGFPYDVYLLRNSRIHYQPDSQLILIEPVSAEKSLTNIYSRYVNGQRAYIFDALSRGISLARPEGPYLEVYLISEKWGEISERIPLSNEQADSILTEELTEIIPGFGFAATLYHNGESIFYNENRGIPQSVLDLAVEKCDYRFGDPGMIMAPITEAKLECSWLNEPLYADEAELKRLGEILKNAQFGYVGACGYGAKPTVRMGNEMVTMFKGTDGCDTIVFGSYSGYFIGDTENIEFWSIFGLDHESKMPKAPEIHMSSTNGNIQLSEADAQYIYDAINCGKRYETSPACACDYSLTVGDTQYIYHSDCGTFINTTDSSCICLDEITMNSVNNILTQYHTR